MVRSAKLAENAGMCPPSLIVQSPASMPSSQAVRYATMSVSAPSILVTRSTDPSSVTESVAALPSYFPFGLPDVEIMVLQKPIRKQWIYSIGPYLVDWNCPEPI